MTARSSILNRVLTALENREVVAHPGYFKGWRPSTHPGSPTEQFREMFEAAGGEVVSFKTQVEASAWVRDFLADFDGLSVGELAHHRLHEGARPEEWIEGIDPSEVEAGVSLAFGAVAETGSLIMTPQDGRRAQLLPPVHVVFVDQHLLVRGRRQCSRNVLGRPDQPLTITEETDQGIEFVLRIHGLPGAARP